MKKIINKVTTKETGRIFLVLLASFLTVYRIILQLKLPPVTFAGGGVDEHVFVMQATEFLKGNWFGNYNSNTLVKNPMYSFFYIFVNKIGVAYPFALIMFYILSIIVLICALSPVMRSTLFRFFAYIFLLYSPVMLDKKFGFRLYRDALLTPLIVLLVASLIALFLYRNRSKYLLIAWSILAGVSFFSFTYLREDSIWLRPLFYVALAITFFFILFGKERVLEKVIKMGSLLIPIAIFFGLTMALSQQNEEKYGIYAVNDHTQTHFQNVIADLIAIDDGTNQEYIWVHRTALRSAMGVSPTLRKLEEQFDSFYVPNSTLMVKIDGEKQQEMFSGKVVWLLRLAVERAGVGYQQELVVNGKTELGGKATDNFYKAIHEELTAGFNDGRLKKRSGGISVSKSAPAKKIEDIKKNVLPKILYTAQETALYRSYFVTEDNRAVSGDVMATREIEMLINSPLNYPVSSGQAQYNKPIGGVVKRINRIISLYKITSIPVIILSIIGFVSSIINLKRQGYNDKHFLIVLVSIGLVLSYFILLLGVSWAYSWVSGDTMNRLYFYSSGAIPILQIIYILCFGALFEALGRRSQMMGKHQKTERVSE